jgi:tetratricopeptide (TPR) repeat protein
MPEASDMESDLDAGLAHHEAGRLARAEAIYRRILDREPDHPDALNLLGVILQDSGDLAGSIAVLSRVVAIDPEFPEAFVNLARAQCAADDPAAAKRSSERAIELDPDLADGHLQLARSLLALHDDAAAVTAATRAAILAPDSADAQMLLGHAQSRLKDFSAAAAAYRAADHLAPDRYETLLNLGTVLGELKQLDDAVRLCRRAVTLKPEDAYAHIALGGALRRAEDLPGSVDALNRAFELAPERRDVWLQQGDNYALMGRFDAAADCYNRLLALDPASSEALGRLTAIGKLTDAAGAYGSLQTALSDSNRPMHEREAAGFALGALLDEAGNYEAAFTHYAAANRLAREASIAAGTEFDLVQFRRRIDQLRTAFDPAALGAVKGWGNPSDVPVFIVGMPRSGTTLVEQILASHPQVHGAGEQRDIFEIAGRLEGETRGPVPSNWDQAAVQDESATQLARLQALGGSADRVIDKLPDNILQLGHIAVLFPNARVIICRRDPRDICLSCYLQHFRDGMAWTSDLAEVAARASEVLRLMDHWRDVLPLRILDVHYETLVDDLEGESRRMIDFLGLDWDDACLSYHTTERAVQTASFWQVRQKLYSSSVGRWLHYRPYIQPMLDGLLGLLPVDGIAVPVPRILSEARSQVLAGHIEPAESAYRLVIEREPANTEALHRLGELVRGRGDARQAVSLLRRAVVGRPHDSALLVELSRAYRLMGDFPASAETAGDALALNQADASAQFLLGSARLDLNDAAGAKDVLARALELAPQSADAQLYFAMACMRLKEFPAAAAALREAVRLKPDDAECLTKFGRVLCELGEYSEALPSLRRAIELAPEDGRVHLALVTALWGTRDVAATEAACNEAVCIAPEMAELWVHSGYCKAALGRFDEAADCYRRAIALEPDLDTARYGLVFAGHQGEVQPDVARLRNVLEDPSRDARERATAGHALGEMLDRAGDYDAAWKAYAAANQLTRASHQAAGHAFDPGALDTDVEAIIANFPLETFKATTGLGNTSDRPVFVVGMPRSGTTLVEQIAASHPDVFGAGELDDIGTSVARIVAGPHAWDPGVVARESSRYLQKLGELGGDAKRVIDKMPDNFQWLGHIAVLFPHARVIICRRDFRDVGLSCHLQHFNENLPWSTSLADIAWRAQAFERLVSHWRSVLPLAILEVQYEDLVHELETESRRLIEFLGLEWDPACLAFHETERAVVTASLWQVRQPLFTSSIGRWRHYRGHLQPLLAGLAGLVPSDGDEDWDSLAATPATALTIAVSHHRAGRLDYAESIYRALLRRNQDDPTALHLLGLLLMDRETPAESVALITRALALRPDSAPLLASLARAYCAAGDADAAIETARQAMTLDPALPDPLVQMGYALLLQQDHPGAIEVLRRAIEMAPRLLEAWIALATALTGLKDHESAAEAWQTAVALKPNDARLLTDLAASLVELKRLDEALTTLRHAAALAPEDPRVQYGFAHCLLHTGHTAAAADTCRRALEASPDWPGMWLLLANCEAMQGHFDAAAEAYRRTLALEPGLVDALHDLVSMGGRFDDDATKRAVRDVLDDQSRPVRDRVAAGFALGQVCDRSGAYDEAFAAFALANRLLRDDRAAHGFGFDRNQFRASVDRLIAVIDAQTFIDTAGWGDPSELPVFIVGMPRSGTSLVEQIASSHPSVFGAGEQAEIPAILAALGDAQTTHPPTIAWDRTAVRRETTAHIQHLHGLGGDAIRVIDKQPDNILRLGQIAALFPRARIVVCRRDLRDVGLSCFVQYFREDELTWTNDLADCAFREREIERLMQHWRQVLPCPILEIDYETLVANLESESRRLIDFLGLEWDPACLAFHETERTVMTASHWQVRQPLYASSVGRWRHYRRHLQPLLAGLAGLVTDEGEDDWDALATDPATALAIGVSHYQAGRLDYAESIYRAVLRHSPDDPAALHLLGLLVLDRGEPAESVALITRSLALRPDVAPVLADLSGAHRAAGNAAAAVEAAQHAVALDPILPVALVQLGYALLMQQDAAGAVQALRQATQMAPGLAEAWPALATALTQQGDHASAADAWEAALALRPDDPGLLTEFAASLAELRRFEEALATYRHAETMAPGDPRVQYGIARSLMHTGNAATAAAMCRQALETTPDTRFWLLLANCEAALGHFEAAADACRQALALDPGSAGALHDLVALGQRRDDDAVKRTARAVLGDPSRLVRDRVSAGFALGQVCDRDGGYDEAFEAYAQANRLLHADRNARGFVFDRTKFRELIDRQIATFDPRTFAATAEWGDPSEQPVFVVGMPRSGTSLVEQIAASHRQVFGAGEQAEMLGILTVLEAEQGSHHPAAWRRSSVRREAIAYREHLRGFGSDAERIIDKQPDNILCLGQIATLFPRAHIVVCRRDLRDVSLSCFFQYFRDDLLVWTDDQADCAFRAKEIDRLMDHWRSVLPCPVLEVQYETLVTNLESESRRLVDFLGLDWDPACLAFHETERTVMTASHWQVRQPVYASSVGRWRHYQSHIEPLLRELDGDSIVAA